MTTFSIIGAALQRHLEPIPNLRVHYLWPDGILVPALIIVPGAGQRDTFDADQHVHNFTMFLLGAQAQERTYRGQQTCVPYMEEEGVYSIHVSLEDFTTYSVRWSAWHSFDVLKTWLGIGYWGAISELEVLS